MLADNLISKVKRELYRINLLILSMKHDNADAMKKGSAKSIRAMLKNI